MSGRRCRAQALIFSARSVESRKQPGCVWRRKRSHTTEELRPFPGEAARGAGCRDLRNPGPDVTPTGGHESRQEESAGRGEGAVWGHLLAPHAHDHDDYGHREGRHRLLCLEERGQGCW